ncbi:MAG: acyltransferase family protein [Pseudomonadota bacterium]|nr:acyltransferase family protein [Pseudomonadota bacterium]
MDVAPARLHYLDTMRGVLMLLGVVLHSARPYSSGTWRVNDVHEIPALDLLGSTLHLFRMPAFFVVAGFFAVYLICRRPTSVFLSERMQRVGIPLLVMLFSVNLVQLWFLSASGAGSAGGAGSAAHFFSETLPPAIMNGNLASHLWFLACLGIYFALTATFAPQLRRVASKSSEERSHRAAISIFPLVLAAAAIAPLATAVAAKLIPGLHAYVLGLVRFSTVLEYLPFFAVGAMLCAYPLMLDRFARITPWVIAIALGAGAGMYVASGHESLAWKAMFLFSRALLAWMVVRAVFWFFRRYLDRPSAAFRYLSDASYSVYLFHHIVVIITATWLLGVDASGWRKFLVVMTAASLVPLAVYHFVIRRRSWLAYLFNGAVRPGSSATGRRLARE